MEQVNLSEVFSKDTVIFDHKPFADKEEVFNFLTSKFYDAGIVTDKEAYKNALYYREGIGSTYMGNLIALPHGKCDEVIKPGIALCRCTKPFIYKSCGEVGEVKYIFMLAIAGTQTGDQYIRVLATLAGLLAHDEFIDDLEQCKDYGELLELIKKYN